MNSKILEVSENSLLKAQQYTNNGNYGRAFAHYLVYLELRPNERENIESDFIDVLVQWVDKLKCSKNYDNAYDCIQNALQYYPNNHTILTLMARYFLELDQHENALNYLSQALSIYQNYLPAIKLVNYIKNVSMDRWHIRMLNDTVRNQAFKQAIDKKLAQGFDNVLDIGTGTGLFSMFAARSKYPKTRITACDYSFVMVNLAKNILAANNCSHLINLIPKRSTDIQISSSFPQKANLVVAEVFDSGVFGEDVIPTLLHAWEHLIESYPRGQIIPYSVELNIYGVQCAELARRHRVFSNEIKNLNLESVNIVSTDNKPYDTEDFFYFKEFKYIAKPYKPWVVNFTDIDLLKKLLNGEIFDIKLAHCCNGQIDAFLLWFKLNLDNEISIDNRPGELNRHCCWEQAIFHLDEPVKITSPEPVPISVAYKHGLFEIMINTTNNENHLNHYNVSGPVVRFLNDSQCLEAISKIVDDLRQKFTTNEISILDLAPFPYFGLLMLKNSKGSLKCCVKNEDEKQLILNICSDNDIEINISFIENPTEQKNEKFDAVFVNVLEMEGELNQDMMLHIPLLCRMLKPHGVLLPSCVTLYGTLVQSDWFKRVSQVQDKNVLNFRIAEFIQKYETDEELDFSLQHLEYIELTQPCPLTQINLDKSIMEEICHDVTVRIRESGQANAICYWFEINYMGHKHSTGPENKYPFTNNAAFLLKPEVSVNRGDQITLRVLNYSGLLKVTLVNTDK